MAIALSVQVMLLLLVPWASGWQHASEAELLEAVGEHPKPLLVAYVFQTNEQVTLSSQKEEHDLPLIRESSENVKLHWEKVELAIRKHHLSANIISFDCSDSLSTCLELNVKAYPAIRLYHSDGRIIRYRGSRNSKCILAFLQRAIRPILSSLTTTEQLASFISSDEIVFTAKFTPSEGLLYETHYRRLAEQYHDRYSFGIILSSTESTTSQREGQATAKQSTSKIKCYNAQTNDSFTLTSAELPLPNALNELLTQCTAPLIYEPVGRKQLADLATFSAVNAKSGLIVHFFVAGGNPSTHDSEYDKALYKKEIAPLVKKYSHEVLFTIIDGDEHPGMDPTVGGLPSSVQYGVSVENTRTGELFPYLTSHRLQAVKLGKREDGEAKSCIMAGEMEWFLVEIVEGRVPPWNGKEPGGGNDRKELKGDQTGRHDEL